MGEHRRPPSDLPLDNQARKALAALQRWQKRAADATETAEASRQDLLTIHRKTSERFARDIPFDALLLDVLDLIDIEDGDRWLWRGTRNNKGTPTLRVHTSRANNGNERTVVRYLAIAFGVISEDDWGVLYPVDGDKADVNPWHRRLRRSNLPIGNPGRYTFDPDEVLHG